jgi:two-component system, LytTR family, sensor kinase
MNLSQLLLLDSDNNKLNSNWLIKYKLLHIPFWFVYHYAWWTITIGASEAANNVFFSVYSIKFFFYVIFQAIGVYFNLYYLIPRFLARGRYSKYVIYLLATILINAAIIVLGYYISAWFAGKPIEALYYVQQPSYLYLFNTNSLPSTAASMTLAMSVKLAVDWVQSKQREQALQKEKLETELKFLKSQFNPHFLFNTINSIFVLIHKNPALASDALAKFSDLLRYQLYECNEPQIPIDRELAYLKDFIELERLRQNQNVETSVQIEDNNCTNCYVAPFMLIPFVENAFKHVSQKTDTINWIKLKLKVEQNTLLFEISNSAFAISPSANTVNINKGIGLKNVQRRLNLIYPGAHELIVKDTDGEFCVLLSLTLTNPIIT